MANSSSIEWTEATWNPLTGCTKVSPGCKHCYAERMARRLHAMGSESYQNGFNLTLHPRLLDLPLKWQRPCMIFVNSMSDLFHKDVPIGFIQQVFQTMVTAEQHKFQILTKRPERAVEVSVELPWPKNVWIGTSVENQSWVHRIDHIRLIPAEIRFLSLEPLLGPLRELELGGIDWVIVGGESGPKSRPMNEKWVTEIRDQCVSANVPFFFKQWGGVHKKKAGRELEGRVWDEMPGAPKPLDTVFAAI